MTDPKGHFKYEEGNFFKPGKWIYIPGTKGGGNGWGLLVFFLIIIALLIFILAVGLLNSTIICFALGMKSKPNRRWTYGSLGVLGYCYLLWDLSTGYFTKDFNEPIANWIMLAFNSLALIGCVFYILDALNGEVENDQNRSHDPSRKLRWSMITTLGLVILSYTIMDKTWQRKHESLVEVPTETESTDREDISAQTDVSNAVIETQSNTLNERSASSTDEFSFQGVYIGPSTDTPDNYIFKNDSEEESILITQELLKGSKEIEMLLKHPGSQAKITYSLTISNGRTESMATAIEVMEIKLSSSNKTEEEGINNLKGTQQGNVKVKRAHFHSEPSDQSKSEVFVIKGDKVTILSSEISGFRKCYFINKAGIKTAEGYLKIEEVQIEEK